MIIDKNPAPDAEIYIVRERGINAKGFGHVAKKVVIDPDVPITAIGIYGYLSSMAGSGGSSFTRRSRLLAELQIGKRAYDSNMAILEEKGYITRAQSRKPGGYFGTTIIEFVMIPAHLAVEIEEAQKNETQPTMYSGTIYSLGYGSIPKLVMQDPKISVKAKGLYTYYCAFASPSGDVFPSRERILKDLNISKNSYNQYRKELEDRGYLTTYREHRNGKLAGNFFRLNHFPEQCESPKKVIVRKDERQVPKNSTTDNQVPKNSTTDAQMPQKEAPVSLVPKNSTTELLIPKNEVPVNELPVNSTTVITNTISLTNTNSLLDRVMDSVRERINYSILLFAYENEPHGLEALHFLLNAISNVFATSNPRIMLGKETLRTDYVQEILLGISNSAVVAVIERYLARMDVVGNPESYLLTAICKEILRPAQDAEMEE